MPRPSVLSTHSHTHSFVPCLAFWVPKVHAIPRCPACCRLLTDPIPFAVPEGHRGGMLLVFHSMAGMMQVIIPHGLQAGEAFDVMVPLGVEAHDATAAVPSSVPSPPSPPPTPPTPGGREAAYRETLASTLAAASAAADPASATAVVLEADMKFSECAILDDDSATLVHRTEQHLAACNLQRDEEMVDAAMHEVGLHAGRSAEEAERAFLEQELAHLAYLHRWVLVQKG